MALAPVDYVVLAICGIALLRGFVRGLLREAFSIASLAVAVIAVRLFTAEFAAWLLEATGGGMGELTAPWIAGALLAVAAVAVTTLVARFLRGGAKAAGLGWADRAGGAVIGTAEGLLLASALVWVIGSFAGRDHPVLAESRSIEVFRELERIVETGEVPEVPLPDVALPDVAAQPAAAD
jgi:membrane protein required for colicin V production